MVQAPRACVCRDCVSCSVRDLLTLSLTHSYFFGPLLCHGYRWRAAGMNRGRGFSPGRRPCLKRAIFVFRIAIRSAWKKPSFHLTTVFVLQRLHLAGQQRHMSADRRRGRPLNATSRGVPHVVQPRKQVAASNLRRAAIKRGTKVRPAARVEAAMESAISRRHSRARTLESPSRAVSPTPSASTVLTDAPSPPRSPPLNPRGAAEAVQLHRELESMREHNDGAWLAWARRAGTLALASRWLAAWGIDGRLSERVLGLLFLARADSLSCDGASAESEADRRMTCEARKFESIVRAYLAANAEGAGSAAAPLSIYPAASLSASLQRALRELGEWTKQDKPKMDREAEQALQRLYARLLALRAKQIAACGAPDEAAGVLRLYDTACKLGGPSAKATARRLFTTGA